MALFDETPLSQVVREQSLGQTDPNLRQYTPSQGGTALRRGVEQSLGLGADYIGTLADAAGNQETAQGLYDYADAQMQLSQNQQAGPQVLGDIAGVGSAVEFGVNKAAESLPVSATALGAAALTRGRSIPTQIAAASVPILPVTAGETSYAMRKDPNSSASTMERAVASTGAGAVSAALEVLPEVGALAKLGRGVSEPAKSMAGAVMRGAGTIAKSVGAEALTEGAQDVVSRGAQSLYNDDIGVNPITNPDARQSFLENAAAGAAGGMTFGVPAGAATALQSLPGAQLPTLPSGDAVRQFIGDRLTPQAERIRPEDIPANFEEAAGQELNRETQAAAAAQAAKDALLQRADLTDTERATIQDEVDLDPDAQQAVFDLQRSKEVEDDIRASLDAIPAEGKQSRISPEVPLEAVDAIVQEAGITDMEAANPLIRQWLGSFEPIIQSGQLDSKTIDTALNVFGERGYSVLRALAGSNAQARAAIDNDQASNGKLDEFLFQALKPEYRDSIRPGQLRQLANLTRGAVDRGEGDIAQILETAFQNPREVMAALETGVGSVSTGRSAASRGAEAEITDDGESTDAEYGDTQSVQDVAKRYFGDTSGNRRIKTGGLNIPLPIARSNVDKLMSVAKNAEGLAPQSDMTPVPAVATLRRLGVDPVDVATELGITEAQMRDMVFLEGTTAENVDKTASFIRKLTKKNVEQLNSAPQDPSAGSYLALTAPDGSSVALDVRSMVNAQVFGKRDPQTLLAAMAEGVSKALSEGYTLQSLPDSLVLARYDRGGNEVAITLGKAKRAVGKRAAAAAEGNFPLDPKNFEALKREDYNPNIDFTTGELYLPKREAMEIIDRYAAMVAQKNADQRGIALPAWTQALIDKHGTEFPADFGTLRQDDSLAAQLRDWAVTEGQESKALTALTGRKQQVDVAQERRRTAEERQGPAMEGDAVDEAILTDARTRGIETGIKPDAQAIGAELGMSELDAEALPSQLLEAAGVDPTRTPEKPYKASRPKNEPLRQDFFTTAAVARSAHAEQFWATGDLPSGVNLQGDYAVLGKIAAKGQPLEVVVAKARGTELSADVQRLIEAYQRRGFNIRVGTKMEAPITDSPYSETVTTRVLGPLGDSPAHVILTVGETRAASLARSIGIPVIDLTSPVQQKIAGDILRSYDSSRRRDVARSTMPVEAKAVMRKGEERTGLDRDRDILAASIDADLATNWGKQDVIAKLMRVSSLATQADNDFFGAALAGRAPSVLAAKIDVLEQMFKSYQTEQGKPSLVQPNAAKTTQAKINNAMDYITKVLPDSVRVTVKKMTSASGMYTEKTDDDGVVNRLIELSAYANDPLSVAHHESMHALVSVMAGEKEQAPFIRALLKAVNSPLVISQLRALMKNEPAALEQMVNDPEERIAYMYEFWAAGQLNLSPSVQNWVVKLIDTVRGILGILSNNEKAGLYMAAFRDGKLKDPSAVNSIVMESLSGPERVLRALPFAKRTGGIVRKVIETAHGRLKGYGNPALDKIADAFYADSSVGGQRSGYLQTVRDIVNLYGSQFAEIIRGSSETELDMLATALHTNKRPADEAVAERYDQTKALMRRLYNYMDSSGISLPKVKDYFPQSWDKVAIADNREAFIDMLVENAQFKDADGGLKSFTPESAAATVDTLLSNNGRLELTEDLAGFSPYMEASNERQIILTDRAKAAEFMDHDVVKVVTRYITQAAKRGEYTRHFGEGGEKLKTWLAEAKGYGLDEQELNRDVAPAIQAMEGTLGHAINPYARDFMSGVMTVQNLAILPLAIFSSLIDPMGIAVRGGTVEQAWNAFKAGIRNIPNSVRKNGGKLDIQELAESIGTVESQNVLDMLGDMYGSAYMSDWARKTNNLMFRYNLMEGWNTAMRSAATVAALNFIERHAAGADANSARWMDELGVKASDLVFDEAGKLMWKQADIAAEYLRTGKDVAKAEEASRKTREAITRWVDGAVLRPHAAHRPAWASDPHFMLIWHLKQFTYSFQKTILERVMHEARNGNYNPALVLAAYVPFMIAADFMRGIIQGAGEEPDWKKGMSFGETVWEGTQRAGLLGIRQFVVDGSENPAFALGPTANYAFDIASKAADGRINEALIQGLPGNALWKGW